MANTYRTIKLLDAMAFGVKFTGKAQYYFAFRTDFFANPQVLMLSNGAKLVFIALLSEFSRRSKEELSYCLEHACHLLSYSLCDVKGFLNELEANDIIGLDTALRRPINSIDITEHNITEQQPEKQVQAKLTFDFESIYSEYPIKKGKKQGLAKIKKSVKTKPLYDDFCNAVRNYAAECDYNKTDPKYIKHFSTFCNIWEDYIEVTDPGILAKNNSEDYGLRMCKLLDAMDAGMSEEDLAILKIELDV